MLNLKGRGNSSGLFCAFQLFFLSCFLNITRQAKKNFCTKHLRMRFTSIALLFALVSTASLGQGTIRGKITDGTTGEALIGANVLIQDPYRGVMADLDGNFSLENLAFGTYEVTGSFIGLKSQTVTVVVSDETVVIQNFNLYPETYVIEQAAEVVAKIDRSRDVYMENIKKKNASSLDYISSQQIRRTGDSDAAAAMQRVPGVSTVGNFVFVRGLSDRYIKTTLNGAEVPSINPRRNTIEMDIFPTNLVDNLVVVKSQTANLPGDWSGAYLNVITKDFPESFNLRYSAALGWNSQTTFQDIISSERSGTDWLGMDDGFRDMPGLLQGLTRDDWPELDMPCFYEGLVYMGYEQDLLNMGIDNCSDIGAGNPISGVVNTLGITVDSLENYGMIPLSRTNNAALSELGKSFTKTWDNTRRVAPLDMSHSLSFGNQTKLFGRPLGYIFGFQYKRNARYYSGGEYGRYLAGNLETSEEMQLLRQFSDEKSTETVAWNALLNLSYKLNEFNKISLMGMPNINGQNSSRYMLGINPIDTDEMQEQRTQRYEERRLSIFQGRGEHFLPASDATIEWIVSHSAGRMETPDLKVFYNNFGERITAIDSLASFTGGDGTDVTADALELIAELIDDGAIPENWTSNPGEVIDALQGEGLDVVDFNVPVEVDTVYSINQSFYPSPTRYFRQLNESKLDAKIHYTRPIGEKEANIGKWSVGASWVKTMRAHEEAVFGMAEQGAFFDGDLDAFFADENLQIERGGNYIETLLLTDLINTDEGRMDVLAAYGMSDWNINERLRLNTGVRVEKTDMSIRSLKLDIAEDLSPQEMLRLEGGLNETDWMPSANLVWQLGEIDPIQSTNLRASYSRSIARPVFREKSPFRGFDFETLEVLKGNPLLDGTKIDNFDLRLERYPSLGEVWSASLFYKRFTDPIEQTTVIEAVNTEYTWANVPYANVIGLELETKANLGNYLEGWSAWNLSANLTFIRSRTAIFEEELNVIRNTDPMHPDTRPLFGQAPYIVNAILTYAPDSSAFNATVAFNVQGEKLILTTSGGLPDIYQQPTPSLDFSSTYRIGERFTLGVRGRNLLNPVNRKTHEFQGQLYDWLSFTTGRSFRISLAYSI